MEREPEIEIYRRFGLVSFFSLFGVFFVVIIIRRT